jgi:hypothetical protein
MLTGGIMAIISSQSAGALVSLIAATAAALAVAAVRRGPDNGSRHRLWLVAPAGLVALGLPFALKSLVDLKVSEENGGALTARGLGFLSGIQSSGVESGTSLLSSLAVDGAVAVLPILGLVVLVVALRHNPFSLALAVFFLLMGLLIQPVQWHGGIWFACALLATAVPRSEPRTSIPQKMRLSSPGFPRNPEGFP